MREFFKKMLPSNWQQLIGWLTVAVLCSVLGWLGYDCCRPPMPPAPFWEHQTGWIADPEAVNEIADGLPFKVFSDTPAGQSDDPLPKAVYLWHAYKKIHGTNPPSKNQGAVGSCVSFGTNNAVTRTMAVQIAFQGAAEEFKDIAEEVTYAGSRVEVGGGKIRGDGSVGAWAAKFVRDWGVVPREKVGAYDLTTYDVARCRAWGNKGVPEDLEALAKEHPVKEITLVKTWAEAKRSLANGYGIAICSNVGFDGNRDANGVKKPRGNWAHCMCLDGYHVTEDGREFGHIENSWGPRPGEGPVGWGDPPTSGFWAESAVIERMLRAGDSWAFSLLKGFPARRIDWFVLAPPGRADGRTFYAQLMRPVVDSAPHVAEVIHAEGLTRFRRVARGTGVFSDAPWARVIER